MKLRHSFKLNDKILDFIKCLIYTGLTPENTTLEKLAAISSEIQVTKEIVAKLQQMEVDATEYACLKGIVMFKAG